MEVEGISYCSSIGLVFQLSEGEGRAADKYIYYERLFLLPVVQVNY